ncbi:MAG: hypothetical protein B6D64_05930 [Bacteroidetes bacterium 4484_276]|nr:MAG: hypothetical protein B6D64_05930 [Bacteroidetes bacterium 4484_276]OYT13965.1 MAG: hypothetical protein B6I19_02385 [Bacteroidetes bacterium 4572_114]
MKNNLIKYLSFLLLLFPLLTVAQGKVQTRLIHWDGIQEIGFDGGSMKILNFSDAVNDDAFGILPIHQEMIEIKTPGLYYKFEIQDPVFAAFDSQNSVLGLPDIDLVTTEVQTIVEQAFISGKQFTVFKLLPLRLNPQTGLIEKLVQFNLSIVPQIGEPAMLKSTRAFRENSVLASEEWFKVSVSKNGIYKVTYAQLKEMGMDVDNIDPENIKLYGNGGGMLPELNSEFTYNDPHENAIVVEDGGDGSFDAGDYILFYGESPDQWVYEPIKLAFKYIGHRYSDYTYYFITAGGGAGKRITTISQSSHPPTETFTSFHDFGCHELNQKNLIHSGAVWYGEEFGDELSYDLPFVFPNADTGYANYFVVNVAAKSPYVSTFSFHVNEDSLTSVSVPAIPPQSVIIYANAVSKNKRFKSSSDTIVVSVDYNKPHESSLGWLDNIQLNVMRHLIYPGGQLAFRNVFTVGSGNVSEFQISSAPAGFYIWDVTDPLEPKKINTSQNGETFTFTVETDSLREFIGFEDNNFLVPNLIGEIENQNLHALQNFDFVIISHPDFIVQAERLKALHEELDDMQICVVTPGQIFNEFSSGSQDPTAIRNFVKMIYQRSGTPSQLKYLLLFGDGSYDPKNRIEENKNFVMTYQSKQSLKLTSSYVTDDFFGLMDPIEGTDAYGNVDIGIGRLPVSTPQEAKEMVDKIENYMRFSEQTQGSWKNKMCFVADDEDYNLHFFQADTVLAKNVARMNPSMNLNKIYLDAFQQISTSSGHRYPEANKALNQQVEDGALFINYTGHGGEKGWSVENVLQISDINSWTNFNTLPVFITATCEFSRFDNPSMTSAGELVLLNPNGGGIALLTTTRLAFAQSNLTLNRRIYDTLFRSSPDNYPRLGDLIKFSKTPSNTNIRNFVLLGDPAIKPAFPKYDIVTETINGITIDSYTDTLKANGMMTVTGYIADFSDERNIIDDFNGMLYPVLYDKAVSIMTLGNDPKSSPAEFQLQDRVLYKGKVSVTNGEFSFSFVIPKDISYQYGNGKLSYYAADSLRDAGGYFDQFILGGYDGSTATDDKGPEITMYLNDSLFINGSEINNSPILFAGLSDPGGINTSGSGIGHDIVATLDGDESVTFLLNDYFDPQVDDFTSGNIVFPFNNLSNGKHTLELKAWDMFNNSSSSIIEFYVSDSLNMDVAQVLNYPNPFANGTYFTFRHNQFGEDLRVEIEIYNFNGQLATVFIPQHIVTNGYTVDPIYWDGEDNRGNKLNPGFYFYKIKVGNGIGYQTERVQKLVISN